jgi:hypothetical protein
VTADIAPYTRLITSEHNDKPNFVAVVSLLVQGLADTIDVLATMPGRYDLDVSVGVQEDADGIWIGKSRILLEPLPNVYFSFDTVGLGWDQGAWLGPFDPITGLVALGDEDYRRLLRATIAANHWDGSIPQAYAIFDLLFAGTGIVQLIQDRGGMQMILAFIGTIPDAITLGLLETGQLLRLKPVGVTISDYMIQSLPAVPFFGFDVENASIAGWDVGAWGTILPVG